MDENKDNEGIDGLPEADEPINDISEKDETPVAETVESGDEIKNKTERKLTRKELFKNYIMKREIKNGVSERK